MTTTQQIPAIVLRSQEQSPFIFDKRREGFRLVDDAPLTGEDLLLPEPIIQDWEVRLPGGEMEARASAMGSLAGQRHAEALYRQKEIIPVEWQSHIHIFMGTDWRGQLDCRTFPCLGYKNDWQLFFLFLGSVFTPDYLLVRLYRPNHRSF